MTAPPLVASGVEVDTAVAVRVTAADDDWLAVRQVRYTAAVVRAREAKAEYERALRHVARCRRLMALAARTA